jgi:hypothetical protein
MKDRFDIHQDITNRIVSAIEAGAGEFKLPRSSSKPESCRCPTT